MSALIEIKDMYKIYNPGENEVRALDGVSLTIEEGEFAAVIGHSGSGKSTLMNMIGCLDTPTEGTYLLDGRDVSCLTDNELSDIRNEEIGFIFQGFNLLMQRTALDNICFPMEIAKTPRREAVDRAKELLEIVDLSSRANAYPAQLSGGQKQRVAIARALANDPKVLLCDEATSALDPQTTQSILRLIKDINRKTGITVVVITHEMAVVEEICTHVAILDHGRVMETGSVEQVFSSPQTEAGRRLVYPDGVVIDQLPAANVIRIAFNGGSSYEPLIASLAIDCGVKVNILGADTRNVNGQAFGTMLLGLPGDPAEAAKAIAYIKNQPNVTMEEVRDYHD